MTHNSPRKRAPRSRSGFTLVELLVVIGIILILLGLLFPAISIVQKQARMSATKQEMSRLASAIQAYFGDFRAYPGPFMEDQVYPQGGTAANPGGTYNGVTIPYIPYASPPVPVGLNPPLTLNPSSGSGNSFIVGSGVNASTGVTSSENLYLGLEGLISYPNLTPSNTTPTFYYTPPSSGPTGPASLNVSNPKVYSSYMSYSATESTYDGASDANAGLSSNTANSAIFPNSAATDSSIPEFVDHFSPARPILYMRARVGTTGMLCHINGASTSSYPASETAQQCQYNENQLVPYGWAATTSSNSSSARSTTSMGVWVTDFPIPATPSGYSGAYIADDVYFANPAQWGVPQGKDGYILISAGPDGIYGTKDDIVTPG